MGAGRIAAPVGRPLHQRDGRLVAVFRLAADIAHRLVNQDGHLLLLVLPWAGQEDTSLLDLSIQIMIFAALRYSRMDRRQ